MCACPAPSPRTPARFCAPAGLWLLRLSPRYSAGPSRSPLPKTRPTLWRVLRPRRQRRRPARARPTTTPCRRSHRRFPRCRRSRSTLSRLVTCSRTSRCLIQRAAGKSYDFGPLFAPTKPYIEGADVSICHLEVPVAPPGTKISTYPMFGAPGETRGRPRDARAGMDVPPRQTTPWTAALPASRRRSTRSKRRTSVTRAPLAPRTNPPRCSSTTWWRTDAPSRWRTSRTRTGSTGYPVPKGKPWSVNVFDANDADVQPILNAAADARTHGADIVIASVHCCVEYVTQPSATQKAIVAEDRGLWARGSLRGSPRARSAADRASLPAGPEARACGSPTGSAITCRTRTPARWASQRRPTG